MCGHPGTGKTSTLNYVLSKLKDNFKEKGKADFEVFSYNAMTFADPKNFAFSLVDEINERCSGQ